MHCSPCSQANSGFYLEVVKDGTVLERIDLDAGSQFVVGRIPLCDIMAEHPSLSRYHAVLQHSTDGVYG